MALPNRPLHRMAFSGLIKSQRKATNEGGTRKQKETENKEKWKVRPNRGIPAVALEPSLIATEHSKRPHRMQTCIRGSIQKSRRETRKTKTEDTGRKERKK